MRKYPENYCGTTAVCFKRFDIMSSTKTEARANFMFDRRTYDRMYALAHANFPTPKRGGNITALIRALINQAWAEPEKFGLLPPEPAENTAEGSEE